MLTLPRFNGQQNNIRLMFLWSYIMQYQKRIVSSYLVQMDCLLLNVGAYRQYTINVVS